MNASFLLSQYGEIGVKGFAEVLFHVAPTEEDVFVDLGSGTGKAVLMAAALYPVKKSVSPEPQYLFWWMVYLLWLTIYRIC